jgi:hypothetical protein
VSPHVAGELAVFEAVVKQAAGSTVTPESHSNQLT